ncbi:aminotransferase class IV [Myroides odoratimimus]|uniref:aminotransferase class IV n=1 Tax=Myroides odoratimimus TaxID=76832 RepID=UPI00103AA546|nr:aminotransferase class IV [Myroides odoratimimus]MCA4792022.1 aminotransferase class IV [Myroides odoratimimus]MCA4805775.1 aminotransferase class IV [Myroides odoratimimus]MCA4819315.1 aminotransferase class IV [Myroides odoratimimus]MDM1058456.1 aminotransferase class IV [Myroides odoratimimus]MDM1092589.1 aminotransferase class IV [Myroides odoratimimus]
MINVNGKIVSNSDVSVEHNRGFLYGDAVFETVRVLDKKVLFLEDHYFRLMSSMRILRMEIPMEFTMEYFQEEILKTINSLESVVNAFRVRFTVYRDAEGKYLPTSRKIGYIVSAEVLNNGVYSLNTMNYEIELYKDFYITSHLLSTLKTNNRLINVTGSIFAEENDYQNCLLLNDTKNIVEALNGNIFIVKDNVVKTPPLSDGCVKGIMRKQVIELLQKHPEYKFEEAVVSPFELQKADELFITNVIMGIQPVTKYRKKEYGNVLAADLVNKLNAKIRLM